jgi:cytochrome c oxidase assembly factor CtaG
LSFSWYRVATSWQTGELALVGFGLEVCTAAVYVYGVSRLRRRARPWPIARTSSFLLGVFALAFVLQSGFASYDDDLLWVHMVQHLVIMMLAAPLLALGAPVRLSLAAGSPRIRRFIAGLLHDPSLHMVQGRFAGVLLPLDYFGSMALLLLTPLYRLSELNNGFHEFVHVYFLACGLMFWVSLLGADPSPWRPRYSLKWMIVALGIPVCAAIAALMVAEGQWLSPAHSVADIERGALAMAVGGFLLTALGLALLHRRECRQRAAAAQRVSKHIAPSPPERVAGHRGTSAPPLREPVAH